MKTTSELHGRLQDRTERLDEEQLHLFALSGMVRSLRDESEYEANGHTGVTLLKTRHLRVVLEAARSGGRIAEHTVHGPTFVHVLEGSLHVALEDEARVAQAGEMVVIPHDCPRELRAEEESAFLLVLSLDENGAGSNDRPGVAKMGRS